jgi:hypothetical protein
MAGAPVGGDDEILRAQQIPHAAGIVELPVGENDNAHIHFKTYSILRIA